MQFPKLARTLKASAGVLLLAVSATAANNGVVKRPPHAVETHQPLSHDVESRKAHETIARKAHPAVSHAESKRSKTKPPKVQQSGIASFISPPHNTLPSKR